MVKLAKKVPNSDQAEVDQDQGDRNTPQVPKEETGAADVLNSMLAVIKYQLTTDPLGYKLRDLHQIKHFMNEFHSLF